MLARTLALVCLCTASAARADCVVLLHGLAQTIVFLRGGAFAADLSLGAALKIAAGGGG